MTLLLRGGSVYVQVHHRLEAHYEQIVEQALPNFLDGFRLYRCRPTATPVDLFESRRRPDFILIEEHHRNWMIVEVELAHHSLDGHVRPQIEAFVGGDFEEEPILRLAAEHPDLDAGRLRQLINYKQPGVLVIVDDRHVQAKGWNVLERDCGAHLGFLEVFRSSDDDPAYSYSGYLPQQTREDLTVLRMHPQLNALLPREPTALPAQAEIRIRFDGRQTSWRVTRTADSVYLLPSEAVPLRRDVIYRLLRADDGSLEIAER